MKNISFRGIQMLQLVANCFNLSDLLTPIHLRELTERKRTWLATCNSQRTQWVLQAVPFVPYRVRWSRPRLIVPITEARLSRASFWKLLKRCYTTVASLYKLVMCALQRHSSHARTLDTVQLLRDRFSGTVDKILQWKYTIRCKLELLVLIKRFVVIEFGFIY